MPCSRIYTMLKCQLNSKRSEVLSVVPIIIVIRRVRSIAAWPPQPNPYLWRMGLSVGFQRLPDDSQVPLELRCPDLHDTCTVVTFGSDVIDEMTQQIQLEDTHIGLSRDMTFQAPKDPPGDLWFCGWWRLCGGRVSLGEVASLATLNSVCAPASSSFCLPPLPLFWGASLLVSYLPGASSLCDTTPCHHTFLSVYCIQDCRKNSWRHPSPA